MYSFDDIAAVQSTLERMANRSGSDPDGISANSGALVLQLARQPGSRESRFAHLLCGPISAASQSSSHAHATATSTIHFANESAIADREQLLARIATLEAALAELLLRVDALEAKSSAAAH
jgi:hypothetical protein